MKKLNKKSDGYHSIEEEKIITDGVYEGYLNHGNIRENSISVWSGKGMTGKKIDNYFLSTTEEKPWQIWIKIFAKTEKVYVIYESEGDTVDADDINELHNSIDEEINRAKSVENTLSKNKADAIYVGKELAKKVDKVEGKRLSTEDYTTTEKEKLNGIEEGANKYIHPVTHSADMIVETDVKQFVTQTEKDKWNNFDNSEGSVKSVNNKTGDVMLNASDVGAEPSINKKTGFNLDKSDSVTSTSSSTLATSKAVKSAYDKALQAFQSASNGKSVIATAITGKGINTSSNDTFIQMANNIKNLPIGLKAPYNAEHVSRDNFVDYTNKKSIRLYSSSQIEFYDLLGTRVDMITGNYFNYVGVGIGVFYYCYNDGYRFLKVLDSNGTVLYTVQIPTANKEAITLVTKDYYIYENQLYNNNGTLIKELPFYAKSDNYPKTLYMADNKLIISTYSADGSLTVLIDCNDVPTISAMMRGIPGKMYF